MDFSFPKIEMPVFHIPKMPSFEDFDREMDNEMKNSENSHMNQRPIG